MRYECLEKRHDRDVHRSGFVMFAVLCLYGSQILLAHPPVGPYQAPGPHAHPNGTNVLVLYNTVWRDDNSNGLQDSFEVAQYYSQRRAIPTNNLLGVTITEFMDAFGPPYGPDRSGEARLLHSTNVAVRYDVFYSNIVVPVAQLLSATNAMNGRPYHDDILFICPVFGLPYYVDTAFTDTDEYPVYELRGLIGANPEFSGRLRSLDLMLGNVYRRLAGGIVWTNGLPKPGRPANCPYGYAPYWGDDQVEIGDPTNTAAEARVPQYFDCASDPATARHFADVRAADGCFNYESNGFFLITRLDAPTAELAKGLVDKALYAERYLNNWAGQPHHPYYLRIYCGDDDGTLGGASLFNDVFQDNRGVDMKNWFLGVNRGAVHFSVFDSNVAAALPPWDVVYDNVDHEIGENGATPTMRLTIAGVTPGRLSFSYVSSASAAAWMLPPLEYGGVLRVTNNGCTIMLQGPAGPEGTYAVDSTNGCAPGYVVEYTPVCAFPITDALFYSEYYTIDSSNADGYSYRDCWLWPPGAFAIYNQSWAAFDFRRIQPYQFVGPALTRGLTATAGAVAEPLNAGIPLVPRLLRAFSQGFCWAEACYNSLYLSESWMTVFIGDPLYNPFMSLWTNAASAAAGDQTPPLICVTNVNNDSSIAIIATLDDSTDDAAVDICQFRLFAGADSNNWAITNAYIDWPNPTATTWQPERRYGYSRTIRWTVPAPTNWFFYQVSARDPYGNETVDSVRTAVIPEPCCLLVLVVLMHRRPGA